MNSVFSCFDPSLILLPLSFASFLQICDLLSFFFSFSSLFFSSFFNQPQGPLGRATGERSAEALRCTRMGPAAASAGSSSSSSSFMAASGFSGRLRGTKRSGGRPSIQHGMKEEKEGRTNDERTNKRINETKKKKKMMMMMMMMRKMRREQEIADVSAAVAGAGCTSRARQHARKTGQTRLQQGPRLDGATHARGVHQVFSRTSGPVVCPPRRRPQ